ncbi:protein-glucosylgalactosylhydroxylysine glucosidase-like, partial [Saccoglossus kowalevskii]|uniref:Acid trehalase-like protein 1-like n=1 Tax=Saccoglossus kowalevskii TaxID=10224 RepID=A0ABM0MA48_SACKO
VSHRARISSKNAIRVHFEEGLENEITRRYDLNVAEGIWYETMTHADFVVTVRIFAHRVYTRVLVTQFEFQSLGDREVTLTLINNEGAPTEDISFSDPVEYQFDTKIYKTMNGETKLAETPVSEKATVYVYYNELDNKITLGQTDNGRIHNYVTSIDQKNDVAKKEFDDVMGSINADEGAALLQAHIDAWSNTWNQGKIEVDDLNLGKIIYGSFYYILSSLPVLDEPPQPRNQFYGLSPGGLTRGSYLRDYQGHSFWDTETWMYPCIMMFFPTLGKDILSYRWLVREEAKQRAACNWHNGTRFPWESAFTGAETTPDCCYETRENQQHVTSDIAFAARQYLSATRDVDWLNDWGCEFLRDIAKYWQSRVTYNEERDAWEIL